MDYSSDEVVPAQSIMVVVNKFKAEILKISCMLFFHFSSFMRIGLLQIEIWNIVAVLHTMLQSVVVMLSSFVATKHPSKNSLYKHTISIPSSVLVTMSHA